MPFNDKVVLITGGTGSFGQAMTSHILEKYKPKKLLIFSRDELKQYEMAKMFPQDSCRFLIGDVRDRDRLYRAFDGVDLVIHAAAQKQVPASEYNPFEAIKTNVIGAANIIDAAIDRKVEKVIALSSDKAANPVNLYGATKLCADKLFVASNAYAPHNRTKLSVVRYGNVIGSRGSVVHLFKEMAKSGSIPITDERMTRFFITLPQAVQFVASRLRGQNGGEIFIPKLPSMKIIDLAEIILPRGKRETIGIRPGEKLHEVMFGEDDSPNTYDMGDYFVIHSPSMTADRLQNEKIRGAKVSDRFSYSSDSNSEWLGKTQMLDLLKNLKLL